MIKVRNFRGELSDVSANISSHAAGRTDWAAVEIKSFVDVCRVQGSTRA